MIDLIEFKKNFYKDIFDFVNKKITKDEFIEEVYNSEFNYNNCDITSKQTVYTKDEITNMLDKLILENE